MKSWITGAAMAVALVGFSSQASAISVTFSTSDTGTFTSTGFGGGTSTIVFTGNPGTTLGIPSIVNLGDFLLSCTSCSTTTANTAWATYATGQTINLIVTDTTDSATGHFVGTLVVGGKVFNDSSPLQVSWGDLIVDSGSFGSTISSSRA